MKILIADDDLIPRRVLERTLTDWGYQVIAVADGQAAWEGLSPSETSQSPPRLAIIDWLMPNLDGLELCRKIRRELSDDAYVYVLLLTGKSETKDIVAGLEAGADDYLTKPFEPAELRARLRVGRRLLDLHGQLIKAREELRIRATRDPLTHVWNRAAILDLLRSELSRGRRGGQPVAILVADVDYFKRINDTYGHPAGDSVLREVSRRMVAAVRPYDAVGRIGGEEFLIVLPECDELSATKLATRLRLRVGETPIDTTNEQINVTLSVGVVATTRPDPDQVDALLQAADAAMYQAKQEGRNRVAIAASP